MPSLDCITSRLNSTPVIYIEGGGEGVTKCFEIQYFICKGNLAEIKIVREYRWKQTVCTFGQR